MNNNNIQRNKLIKLGFQEGGAFQLVYNLSNGDDNYITYETQSKIFELTLHSFILGAEDEDDMNTVRIFIDNMDELKLFINMIQGYTVKTGAHSFVTGLTKKEFTNYNKNNL